MKCATTVQVRADHSWVSACISVDPCPAPSAPAHPRGKFHRDCKSFLHGEVSRVPWAVVPLPQPSARGLAECAGGAPKLAGDSALGGTRQRGRGLLCQLRPYGHSQVSTGTAGQAACKTQRAQEVRESSSGAGLASQQLSGKNASSESVLAPAAPAASHCQAAKQPHTSSACPKLQSNQHSKNISFEVYILEDWGFAACHETAALHLMSYGELPEPECVPKTLRNGEVVSLKGLHWDHCCSVSSSVPQTVRLRALSDSLQVTPS